MSVYAEIEWIGIENAAINICREGIRISGMMLDIEKKIS